MASSRYVTVTATGIISIILLVLGIFLLSFYNLNIFTDALKEDMQVIVYLKKNVSPNMIKTVEKKIKDFEEIQDVAFISKDRALNRLMQDMSGIREIVRELEANPLPNAFRISLVKEARTPEGIKRLVDKFRSIKEIEDVDYGKELVERLDVFVSTLRLIGIVIGVIIIFVVLFVVSNTVKFTLFTRRDEIEIMKYAGATNSYIKFPFVIEGGVLGLVGAICSVGLLFLTYEFIIYRIPQEAYRWLGEVEFTFIPYELMIAIVCAGVILGSLGSWWSVRKYLGVAILVILCLNVTGTVQARNQAIHKIEKKIEESQKKLKDINKKIKEKKRATRKVKKEAKKVKRKIELSKSALKKKRKRLSTLAKRISMKEEEIKTLKKDIELLIDKIDDRKVEIGKLVSQIYRSRVWKPKGLATVILVSRDYHDLLARSRYEELLITEANRIIKKLNKEIDGLEGTLFTLNRRYNTLLSEKDKLEREKSRIEKEIRRNRLRLASIEEKKAEYEKELKRLAGASASLKNLLKTYEKKRKELVSRGTGFKGERGRLIWPLKGKVISRFGRQKHPEFDAYVFKKGIEIASKGDRNVKVVYDGVVAYADWLQGYGLIVIVDHGNSFYSIYAHASRLNVSKGDKVKKGQAIAVAGAREDSSLMEIYFEIRHNGEPVNPLTWLARK